MPHPRDKNSYLSIKGRHFATFLSPKSHFHVTGMDDPLPPQSPALPRLTSPPASTLSTHKPKPHIILTNEMLPPPTPILPYPSAYYYQ